MYLHVLEVSIEFSMSGYLLPLQKYHLYRGAKDKHKDSLFDGQDIFGVLNAVMETNTSFEGYQFLYELPLHHGKILYLNQMRKEVFECELISALEAIWNSMLKSAGRTMKVNSLSTKHSHSIAAGTAVYIEKSWQ